MFQVSDTQRKNKFEKVLREPGSEYCVMFLCYPGENEMKNAGVDSKSPNKLRPTPSPQLAPAPFKIASTFGSLAFGGKQDGGFSLAVWLEEEEKKISLQSKLLIIQVKYT